MNRAIEIDEFTNAFDYLEKTKLFLFSKEMKYRLKWLAISYSSAFYSVMIAMLTSGNFDNVLDWEKRKKEEKRAIEQLKKQKGSLSYMDYYNVREALLQKHDLKLIGFNEALSQCENEDWHGSNFLGARLNLNTVERNAIEIIKKWKNEFIHFIPKTLLFTEDDILEPICNSLRALRFLFLEADIIMYMVKDYPTIEDVKRTLDDIEHLVRI